MHQLPPTIFGASSSVDHESIYNFVIFSNHVCLKIDLGVVDPSYSSQFSTCQIRGIILNPSEAFHQYNKLACGSNARVLTKRAFFLVDETRGW